MSDELPRIGTNAPGRKDGRQSLSPIPSMSGHGPAAAAADLAAIDAICDRFESVWRHHLSGEGPRPLLETHLGAAPHTLYLGLLRELVRCDLEYRRAAGEQPGLEEYHHRFPRER